MNESDTRECLLYAFVERQSRLKHPSITACYGCDSITNVGYNWRSINHVVGIAQYTVRCRLHANIALRLMGSQDIIIMI